MILRVHPEAEKEIGGAVDWYTEHGDVSVARRFVQELYRTIDKVVENPRYFQLYDGRVRRALLHRFPYLVVYRFGDGLIEIVAVAHVRRRPGYWRHRR